MIDFLTNLRRLGLPRMHLRSILPARAVVVVQPDEDGNLIPTTPAVDQASARESTQQDVLAQLSIAVTALQAINGSTDGIEGLLSALGVKDDNVLTKLTEILAKDEQIRVLLAAQAAKTEAQPVSAASLPLPAGAATSALQTTSNTTLTSLLTAVGLLGTEATQVAIRNALQGTLQVKANPDVPFYAPSVISAGASADAAQNIGARAITAITIGAGWTAADVSFEHTYDGGTNWFPLYDIFGNPLSYKASAGRTIAVPPGDLMRRGTIRLRSGVPGAYIAQASAVAVTYTIVTL